jgi:hypothetical protein
MQKVNGRKRCVLCCRKCFTCGSKPKIKDRDEYHMPLKKNQKKFKGLGRIGNYANHQCSVCLVPLCTKKFRFPDVQKTCWELWHTVPDLMSGPSQTLCHVKNPKEELGV